MRQPPELRQLAEFLPVELTHELLDVVMDEAQLDQSVDVDAGDGSGTQINHDLARITVVERIDQALPISLTLRISSS